MELLRIDELLRPFLRQPLAQVQLKNISMYIDILLRWNSRMNLTSVRDPEDIVTRHFGESFFAAQELLENDSSLHLIDLGSGAGFPGLPMKIWARELRVTLIEANQKKAVFLREVMRTLELTNVSVWADRAEVYSGTAGDVVTLRAVERFEEVLPTAVELVNPGGRLALLIGAAQSIRAKALSPALRWREPVVIPRSEKRILQIGAKQRA